MGARTVVVDPMTRIEGHLRFETRIEEGVVVDARCSGDMFRGIEKALIGHDARVAQQVTQRVCGVCPYAHAEAASLALENALGIKPNANGQILRNLIVGAYQLQDYLLHFYTLSVLDFIDVAAVLQYRGRDPGLTTLKEWVASELNSGKIFPAAPFLPRYQAAYASDRELNISVIKDYLDVLPVMAELHKMVAIFGGKAPHPVAIEAGGVTTVPTLERISRFRTYLDRTAHFIRNNYTNDVLGVAGAFKGYFREGKGWGHLLSYPYFPDKDGKNHAFAGGVTLRGAYRALDLGQITEDQRYAYYKGAPERGTPLESTRLEPLGWEEFERERAKADGKYSWTKAPRYGGEAMEVGPAARIVNTYLSGANPALKRRVDAVNKELGIGLTDYNSVMGRHLSRLLMALTITDLLYENLAALEPEAPAFVEQDTQRAGRGVGLTEATRGALAHWIETDEKGYIRNYEMIVPTTWNISPRDGEERPGPVEKMLIGTRVENAQHPIELARIVRSTDPCMACSVH